jgi:hypothetical protein
MRNATALSVAGKEEAAAATGEGGGGCDDFSL